MIIGVLINKFLPGSTNWNTPFKLIYGFYSSKSASDIQQQLLIDRQQPLEIKKKLCMLKVAKGKGTNF